MKIIKINPYKKEYSYEDMKTLFEENNGDIHITHLHKYFRDPDTDIEIKKLLLSDNVKDYITKNIVFNNVKKLTHDDRIFIVDNLPHDKVIECINHREICDDKNCVFNKSVLLYTFKNIFEDEDFDLIEWKHINSRVVNNTELISYLLLYGLDIGSIFVDKLKPFYMRIRYDGSKSFYCNTNADVLEMLYKSNPEILMKIEEKFCDGGNILMEMIEGREYKYNIGVTKLLIKICNELDDERVDVEKILENMLEELETIDLVKHLHKVYEIDFNDLDYNPIEIYTQQPTYMRDSKTKTRLRAIKFLLDKGCDKPDIKLLDEEDEVKEFILTY